MKTIFSLLIILGIFTSCKKDPQFNGGDYEVSGGVFVVNEGNFLSGNGSLSYWSYDSLKIFNDLFQASNGRPLGDVPYSMKIKDEKAYIVVNNSGKIEVINNSTAKSIATIDGLISPRKMEFIGGTKAYVTSLYSDSVTIIDLAFNSIVGYINLRRTSESITLAGNKAYISNWVNGHEVMVVNTLTNKVIDSIDVGIEPESMVLDNNANLWVLCSGGWSESDLGKLVQINIGTDNKILEYTFTDSKSYPTCLTRDIFGVLYYLDGGVRKMDIGLGKLPPAPMIPQPSGSTFYKIAINSENGDIFVSDALDYSHPGYLWRYNSDGEFSAKETAGIIPGEICFKQ